MLSSTPPPIHSKEQAQPAQEQEDSIVKARRLEITSGVYFLDNAPEGIEHGVRPG